MRFSLAGRGEGMRLRQHSLVIRKIVDFQMLFIVMLRYVSECSCVLLRVSATIRRQWCNVQSNPHGILPILEIESHGNGKRPFCGGEKVSRVHFEEHVVLYIHLLTCYTHVT